MESNHDAPTIPATLPVGCNRRHVRVCGDDVVGGAVKLTTRRRIWWTLKYGNPHRLLRPLQWLIPLAVGLVVLVVRALWELGEL